MAKKRRARIEDDPLAPEVFRWQIPIGGHQWVKGRAADVALKRGSDSWEDLLLPIEPNAVQDTTPLETPALFEKFGATPLRLDSIKTFADLYGWLGKPEELVGGGFPRGQVVERLYDWVREIMTVRAATRLWDAVIEEDIEAVRSVCVPVRDVPLEWHRRFSRTYFPRGGWVLKCHNDEDRLTHLHPIEAVVSDAPSAVDRQKGMLHPLLLLINTMLGDHCSPVLALKSGFATGCMVRVMPKNLLGAIWWQFARAVAGDAHYRKCRVCSRVIELSKEDTGFRSDREFCSPSCKMREHRNKVKRAKELKAAKRTDRQIAKELDTSVEAIRRWLTKTK